ncbi:MAG: PatB family C-S lyase [Cellvibrionaceae bacterium]|nr:PatB family C-S lyase [Cellvibrionaceae bacterium]
MSGDCDFDQPIERAGTDSQKFDGRQQYFGRADIIPMWVADMDFAVPECVTQALARRAAHPVFGYTLYPESLYQSVIDWFQRRHHWAIERDWILMMPGVVPSLHACCLALAEEGDGVIVQPPVYFPFFTTVTHTRRRLVLNPLVATDSGYAINFAELEAQAAEAKILLLCTPHNPVGRVWRNDELRQILQIAQRHDLIVLSDDIHADIVLPGHQHTMLGTFTEEFGDFIRTNLVTAVAPSKTFNIPGLGLSSLIVPDPAKRRKILKVMDLLHVSNNNPFSIVAFEAAYNGGDAWLEALLTYLDGNRQTAVDFIATRLPQIRATNPEGTYLLWLDCRELGLDDAALRHFLSATAAWV